MDRSSLFISGVLKLNNANPIACSFRRIEGSGPGLKEGETNEEPT
jgi:hypothetical protein